MITNNYKKKYIIENQLQLVYTSHEKKTIQ